MAAKKKSTEQPDQNEKKGKKGAKDPATDAPKADGQQTLVSTNKNKKEKKKGDTGEKKEGGEGESKPETKKGKKKEKAAPSAELVESGAGPMTPEEKAKLRADTKEAVARIGDDYFALAEQVHHVYDTAVYTEWEGPVFDDEKGETVTRKYKTFAEYLENELQFGERKGAYLVQIVRWFREELKDDALIDRIRKNPKIGWTKARALSGVMTPENADEWIAKAESMTVSRLEEEARAFLKAQKDGGKEEPAEKVERKGFTLKGDQIETVNEAIDFATGIAKGKGEEDPTPGHVLTLICLDYMAGAQRVPAGRSQQNAFFKKMEGAFTGLKLVVIDEGAKKVVFGQQTFASLVETDPPAKEQAPAKKDKAAKEAPATPASA